MSELSAVLGRVTRRLRWQRAAEAITTVGLAFLLCAIGLLFLAKSGYIDELELSSGLALLGLLPFVAAAAAAARPLPPIVAAALVDRTHGLNDRLSTACEFVNAPALSTWMAAHLRQTLAQLPRVNPKQAAPLRWPRDSRAFGVLTLGLIGVALLRFSAPEPPSPKVAAEPAAMSVSAGDLEPYREALEAMQADALSTQQAEIQALARELNHLLDALEQKKLTREKLFAKLAELEQKLRVRAGTNDELLRKRLKQLGATLEREKLTKELGRALKHDQLQQAKKQLEQLAKQPLTAAQRRKLAAQLKRAAQQSGVDRQAQTRQRALARQIRRLKRQLEQQKNSAAEKRRLQRKRRQLARLNQRQKQLADQRRRLQRLNDQLARAAEELLSKLNAKERETLQRLAEQLGRFAREDSRAQQLKRAQMNLRDLKEMLRRLGKRGSQSRLARLERFRQRAAGQKPCPHCKGTGKKDKKPCPHCRGSGRSGRSMMLPVPTAGSGQGQAARGQRPGSEGSQQPGDGVGSQTDPNLRGDRTALAGKRKSVMLAGTAGKGPTRSQVIRGASGEGFASSSYRRVYHDYHQILEEVLEREEVPLGYRYQVKRYFQLIKPR